LVTPPALAPRRRITHDSPVAHKLVGDLSDALLAQRAGVLRDGAPAGWPARRACRFTGGDDALTVIDADGLWTSEPS
jgi:hypothetical protein